MYEWLVDAFEEMDKTPRRAGDPESLMPEGHALELFVPITDFHGYAREFPLDDPKVIRDTAHRHILEFRYRKGGASEDQFGSNYNKALAFAARATSSFPGAFPPMSLADAKRSGATVKVQPARGAQEEASPFPKLFSAYDVHGARHEESIFVDGGVLDNYPFQSSIPRDRHEISLLRGGSPLVVH